MERKHGDKYTSPDIQNEILHLMSYTILREVVKNIQHADYFTIMVDEFVDMSDWHYAFGMSMMILMFMKLYVFISLSRHYC